MAVVLKTEAEWNFGFDFGEVQEPGTDFRWLDIQTTGDLGHVPKDFIG
jgi:hypothetical protein